MNELLDEGLDSAYAITEIPESSFVKSYAEKVGGKKEAKVIWDWARRLTDSIAKHVAMQLSYIARYDDDQLSKEELKDLVELLCKNKRLLRSFRIHFAMKEGKE
ncbi:MAG: hypothetical protein HQ565_08025 [Bacteroidetes bacterium]|nr:hypothetical protein [Bacteroidota bacterium]